MGGADPGAPPTDEPDDRDRGGAPKGHHRARWAAVLALGLVAFAFLQLQNEVPAPLARGSQAPEFELPELGADRQRALSEFRDHVILLNFWATWCKPCEDEMPAMEELYQRLQNAPFEILAVSVDEDPVELSDFRERLGLSFPILMDPSREVTRRYQTTGFPESLLIDRQGRVAERYVGPRDWDSALYEGRVRALLEQP